MRVSSLLGASLSLATLFLVSVISVPLGGCSSTDKACNDYTPPASFDAITPVVSFKTDVFPIFGDSCAFTTCHGATAGSSNGIFLGGNKAQAVRTALVDMPAPELPSMSFVKPGAPHDSYLMRKLDGSNCLLNAQCTNGSCGDSMPRNDETLPIETRDIIRRWIMQGAPDN